MYADEDSCHNWEPRVTVIQFKLISKEKSEALTFNELYLNKSNSFNTLTKFKNIPNIACNQNQIRL